MTPKFTREDVKRRMDAFIDEVEKAQIEMLQRLGEMCVIYARTIPPEVGFTDQTGNLRSSIGYTILKDGVSIHENYEQVKEGSEGIRAGKDLANLMELFHPKGLALIVTAGMNYAAILEAGGAWSVKSKRGHDVLTSTELLAERELPKMIKDLIDDIRSAA